MTRIDNRSRGSVLPWVSWALLGVACVVAPSGPVVGQSWEVALRKATIDHDPSRGSADTGEAIPPGLGVSVQHVWGSGVAFGLAMSQGSEVRAGAICGGFIIDPVLECIPERVRYSGGLVALSGGWRLRGELGSKIWLGITPTAGVGAVWVSEDGLETQRTYSETVFAFILGAALESGIRLPWDGFGVVVSAGVDQVRPLRIGCEDCRQVVRDALPQVRFGAGVTWTWR